MLYTGKIVTFLGVYFTRLFFKLNEACFKRRASDVPNALKTIDNQMKCIIIYCF